MNTQIYNNKLDERGLYFWCLPEKPEGRRFIQTHKIGMTTRSFASRNKQYAGTMKKRNWTCNFLLPLNVDNKKVREMETFVKKKLYDYAIAHPTDIFPQSKNWKGEYYDVVVSEGDSFKQVVFDLFQQIHLKLIKEREDLLQAQTTEIKYLKKLIVQECKNKNKVQSAPPISNEVVHDILLAETRPAVTSPPSTGTDCPFFNGYVEEEEEDERRFESDVARFEEEEQQPKKGQSAPPISNEAASQPADSGPFSRLWSYAYSGGGI